MSIVIIEGAACFVGLSFIDSTGQSFTPISARYRVDNVIGGQPILAWTPLSNLSPSMSITVTGAQNALVDGTKRTELHQLLLELIDGNGNADRIKADWIVASVVGGTQ